MLTEPQDRAPYERDWTGAFTGAALAVVRPANVAQVAAIVRLCAETVTPLIPQGGNTGLTGAGVPGPQGGVLLSLRRMAAIRGVDTAARTIQVEAGVILQNVQEAAEAQGLMFPLTFGARGSCTIGGALATNAGGSNVVRYGCARALCLGIEAVLPAGGVIDSLSAPRKDNTGYDLRDLLIGAEGTLGVITAATLKLFPLPSSRIAGFVALPSLAAALDLLNRMQDASGGGVEAFEYMPARAVTTILRHFPNLRPPLQTPFETGVFFDVAAVGDIDLRAGIEEVLGAALEEGRIVDAMLAQSGEQRLGLWALREHILPAILADGPARSLDITLPLTKVAGFMVDIDGLLAGQGLSHLTVGHLGDGNLHVALCPGPAGDFSPERIAACEARAYDVVQALGGSLSAEHGVGQCKRDLLAQRKNPVELAAMRAIKAALDPRGIMNPGKML